MVPSRLEAPVTATQRVRSSISSMTRAGSSTPVAGSNGASMCSAPAASQARRHGVTLASWSRRVPTTRSPGRRVSCRRLGEGQRERRHVGAEADPVGRRGIEQRSDAVRPVAQQCVAGVGGAERSAGVGVAPGSRPSPSSPRSPCRPSACRPGRRSEPIQLARRGIGVPGTVDHVRSMSSIRPWGSLPGPGTLGPVPSTPDDKLPIKMLNDRLLVRIPDKDGSGAARAGS